MTKILFTTLLCANPVFASAMNSSIVGLHDVLSASFHKDNFVARGCASSQAEDKIRQPGQLKIETVSLHTRGQCAIRSATSVQNEVYSGIVGIDGPIGAGTGQLVYNDDLGVPENGTRFVLTAIHVMGDNTVNKTLPSIDAKSGKINPNIAKVHIRGCAKDQKVVAICKPPSSHKNVNFDYGFLVLEKSDCQKKAQPLRIAKVEKQEAQNCSHIRVPQVLNQGMECGTAENRDKLSEYNGAAGPLAERKLYIGEGDMYHVNQGDNQIFYKVDTTQGGSGSGIFCDDGSNRPTLIGVHRGDGPPGSETNQGVIINEGITETLKKCAEQTRDKLSEQN